MQYLVANHRSSYDSISKTLDRADWILKFLGTGLKRTRHIQLRAEKTVNLCSEIFELYLQIRSLLLSIYCLLPCFNFCHLGSGKFWGFKSVPEHYCFGEIVRIFHLFSDLICGAWVRDLWQLFSGWYRLIWVFPRDCNGLRFPEKIITYLLISPALRLRIQLVNCFLGAVDQIRRASDLVESAPSLNRSLNYDCLFWSVARDRIAWTEFASRLRIVFAR